MAALAGHRELRRSMIRLSRFQVIRVVAAVTGSGNPGIYPRCMALGAGNRSMSTGKGEMGSAVAEGGKIYCLFMTMSAISTDTGCTMIGIFCGVIILYVTGDTRNIETSPCSFFGIFMATGTVKSAMNPTERETGGLMETAGSAYYCEGLSLVATIAFFA